MVWPSGAALATMLAPMVPPAPGRFSITKVCPTCLPTCSKTTRAMMSLATPAGIGTTTVTLRDGQSSATAGARPASSRRSAEQRRDGFSWLSSLHPPVAAQHCERSAEPSMRRACAPLAAPAARVRAKETHHGKTESPAPARRLLQSDRPPCRIVAASAVRRPTPASTSSTTSRSRRPPSAASST